MSKKLTIGSVAVVCALALTACSGGTGKSSSASSDKPTIAFIQGVIGDEFYISMDCGVQDAAKKLGATVSTQGPQKWDPALQQPILTSVAATKPSAILIAPNDVTALQKPIEQAAANSKIVLVDTTIDDPSVAVTHIASDNEGGGSAAFKAIQELVPDGGKVLVIDNQPGISTSVARVTGFENAIKANSKFEYVGVQYAKNQPAEAARIVTATLQKYPDLKAIFATNIFSAEGAATGIEQAGAKGKVKIVGFDAGPAQVKALQDGTIEAIVAQQPYQIGYQGVEQALKAIKGEPTEKKIQTGFTIITKENLNTKEGQSALYKSTCS